MKKKINTELIVLAAITMLSRIPFLFQGYGFEEDSWGVVREVMRTYETGIYQASRLPGHPLHEAIYLLYPYGSPLFYNGLTALASAAAVLIFALIMKKSGFKNYLLCSYALAFIPVFYISSTYTIDYNWTLAFMLIAFWSLINKKNILAGIMLGCATGCRVTSPLMVLPFMLYLYLHKESFLSYLKLCTSLGLVAFLVYIPLLHRYGINFFMYADQFAYPIWPKIIYKGTIGVFGFAGFAALIIAGILMLKRKSWRHAEENFQNGVPKKMLLTCIAAAIIYFLLYMYLPYKSGYLIPVLPFVLMLFAAYADRQIFRWTCFAMIISPFILSVNLTDDKRGSYHSSLAITFHASGQEIFFDPVTGPVFADMTKRMKKQAFVDKVVAACPDLKTEYIIIAGWWYNQVMVELHKRKLPCGDHFVSYITGEEIDNYVREGFKLYYLPEQDRFNDEYAKINYTGKAAGPFPLQD